MSIELIHEVWTELKHHINKVDTNDAAASLVGILIDHNIEADDIRSEFVGDKEVNKALAQFLLDESDGENLDEDEDPEEDPDEEY